MQYIYMYCCKEFVFLLQLLIQLHQTSRSTFLLLFLSQWKDSSNNKISLYYFKKVKNNVFLPYASRVLKHATLLDKCIRKRPKCYKKKKNLFFYNVFCTLWANISYAFVKDLFPLIIPCWN